MRLLAFIIQLEGNKRKVVIVQFLFLLLFINSFKIFPQDIHFSQFYNSPGTLNPALTGNILYNEFDQNVYRVGGNYKNQWASITVPYRTYSAFADASITTAGMERSQIGLGVVLYNDKSGDGSLQNSSAMINFAVTRGFNRYNTFRATLGFSVGIINRSVDLTKLVFDSQWNGVTFDPDATSNESLSSNSIIAVDFNFGALLTYKLNRSVIIQAGASLNHINKPKISFYDQDNRLNHKFIINANATIQTENNLTIEPVFMYSIQAKASEVVIGSTLAFNSQNMQLILGLLYRLNRDLIPLIGLRYKLFEFSISYDVNISPVNQASNYKGGIELSLSMVFGRKISGLPCYEFY